MTKIVRTSADVFYPFCMIFGFYVVAHGHLTPGGGFQGGAVMATATALLIAAHRYEDVTGRVRQGTMKGLELTGLLGFLLAALSAVFLGKPLLQNWMVNRPGSLFGLPVEFGSNPGDVNTAGLLPLLNLVVGVEVLGGLTLILLYMLSGVKERAEG